jgi:Flp pilus assembly protein TadG
VGGSLPSHHFKRIKKFAQFAVLLPLFLIVVAIGVDMGRLFYGYLQMSNAVRAGATYAAQSPMSSDEINDKVLNHSSRLPALTTLAIICSAGACSRAESGDDVTIKAIWNFEPVTWKLVDHFWHVEPVVLSTQVTMKVL